MKKLISSIISIAVIVLLILISQYHPKNAPKQSDAHQLKTSKIQPQKQEIFVKKVNPCQKSENIINVFVEKLLQIKLNAEDGKRAILQDKSLRKIIIENNECGASSASRLANIYSRFGFKDKANKYHQFVLDFAEKGNVTAIENLCDYDSVATKEQKIYFCKLIIENEKKDSKFSAVHFLGQLYFAESKEDDLLKLCNQAGDNKSHCHLLYLFPLADKFYKEKQYERAIKFYEKIEPYDTQGNYLVANQLAEIYAHGNGTAIDYSTAIAWYKRALEKNYNNTLYSAIVNNMGNVYNNQKDFVNSFKCYKQAAIMGSSQGQRNLAIQYLYGHGTIQDYQEAYAWINIAIAQGLDKNQGSAEKMKNWLSYNLISQDKTRNDLMHAKELAKKYYKNYVLHEIPIAKK